MRPLSKDEQQKLKLLTKNSVSLSLIEPTATGLKKSILDATGSVRNYLKTNHLHDYNLQTQGPKHKVILEGLIYSKDNISKSKVALYRPITKKGDPRIWFYGLTKHAKANDILALICFDKKIHIVNLTQLPILQLIQSKTSNPLKELIHAINGTVNAVANELLEKLRIIARKGPTASVVNADTSVGRTIETALAIPINSSKNPDYKGIELKSFRSKRANRKNLFTQVPDWKLSQFKSSNDILNAFGYWRADVFRLYCTVSCITTNSQGLSLKIDRDFNLLKEHSDKKDIGDFVVWSLDKLHERLLAKHKETFWISADSILIDGQEFFQYTKVEHTKNPIISQFDLLLEQGSISLDHLIKRNAKGTANEKGPSFKLKSNALNLLFPPSQKHSLL